MVIVRKVETRFAVCRGPADQMKRPGEAASASSAFPHASVQEPDEASGGDISRSRTLRVSPSML